MNITAVKAAANRLEAAIHKTPIVTSARLNAWLGHEIYFKAECQQRVGAFKARGALNALKVAIERGEKIDRVIANSSGNHAQAVAWAAAQLGLDATIVMPKNVSKVKAQATASYGANVVLGDNRTWVDNYVEAQSQQDGVLWIPPYNHQDVICGQGTAALEALNQVGHADVIAAPCGGGGLLSGTQIVCEALCPDADVIGAEPLLGNDAARSLREGVIVKFDESPNTLADGARTLAIGDLTFDCLKRLDAFYEIDETKIAYWYQWLNHLLKLQIEPTSAMTMQAVVEHLKAKSTPQKVLVILSGGNVDREMRLKLWEGDHLVSTPSIQ